MFVFFFYLITKVLFFLFCFVFVSINVGTNRLVIMMNKLRMSFCFSLDARESPVLETETAVEGD